MLHFLSLFFSLPTFLILSINFIHFLVSQVFRGWSKGSLHTHPFLPVFSDNNRNFCILSVLSLFFKLRCLIHCVGLWLSVFVCMLFILTWPRSPSFSALFSEHHWLITNRPPLPIFLQLSQHITGGCREG